MYRVHIQGVHLPTMVPGHIREVYTYPPWYRAYTGGVPYPPWYRAYTGVYLPHPEVYTGVYLPHPEVYLRLTPEESDVVSQDPKINTGGER